MKILSEPSKKWTHETACQTCNTRLELEMEDFSRTVYDQRDGDAAIFKCPTCGRENWVDLHIIPRHLHYRLPR